MVRKVLNYLHNIVIAFDCLLNAMALGDPQETISSRAGKQADKGNKAARAFCWTIELALGHDHCHEAETVVESATEEERERTTQQDGPTGSEANR